MNKSNDYYSVPEPADLIEDPPMIGTNAPDTTCRGWKVERKNGEDTEIFVFSDTKEPAFGESTRPCKTCGKNPVPMMLTNYSTGVKELKVIDHCIAKEIEALDKGGIRIMASCCGHQLHDGWITVINGRRLIVRKDENND